MGLGEFYSRFSETYIKLKGDADYRRVLLSNIDNSIVADSYKNSQWLYKLGITEHIQNIDNLMYEFANIGYNPNDKRWYYWRLSSVGSTPLLLGSYGPGDLITESSEGYIPQNRHDMLRYVISKYSIYNNTSKEVTYIMKENGIEVTVADGFSGVTEFIYFPDSWGRGVWRVSDGVEAREVISTILSKDLKITRFDACVGCNKI